MRFDFEFGKSGSGAGRRGGEPTRVLVLADLKGHGVRTDPPAPLAQRAITRVDVDNFDRTIARYKPSVQLGEAGADVLRFEELDSFHPDELYEQAELFRRLRGLRERLSDSATYAQAAAELRSAAGQAPTVDAAAAAAGEGAAEGGADEEGEADLMTRLLGRSARVDGGGAAATASAAARSVVDRLVEGAVAPYIVAERDPQQDQFISAVDVAIGDAMRGLLHYPPFQSLEAAWRGVRWLVATLELGDERELYVLHVGRDELADPGLAERIVERAAQTEGGRRFDVIAGLYRFGASAEDATLLGSLGELAKRAGTTFVAEAKPELVGCASVVAEPDPKTWSELDGETQQRWDALRASDAAGSLALAMPRMLLRLPYGERTDEIDAFEFEEVGAKHRHEQLLWGNPALACAFVVARGETRLGDLPAYVFKRDGQSHLQPCAEVCLTERAATELHKRGIVALLSHKDRNAVTVPTLQTLST